MKKSLVFKPRARLLLQLGDQLIRNESIALLELVKNAYDADAKKVNVSMVNVESKEEGIIIIEDDGHGMNAHIVEDVWMEPGSDYKENLFRKRIVTSRYKRLPLGEKGIGRFGVHKLGSEIELISKMENRNEVHLKIDWNRFEANKYLEKTPIDIVERSKPEFFSNENTGTKIIIKKLRNAWTRAMVREVHRSLNALCSPFDAPDSFKVTFNIDKKEWIRDLKTWKDFKDDKLFKIYCEVEGCEIRRFKYEFCPWPTMTKLQSRVVTEEDFEVESRKRMVDKDKNTIDLSGFDIGKLTFEAFIFDMDSRVLEMGVQDKRGLKEYLDFNGGIRVYRDGVRVYDYGEPGNDWLNLGGRRVNLPTKRLSNNLIIGAVHLNRDKSSALIEKTNREGFIENDAYHLFCAAILYSLSIVESLRNIDKDKIRTFYGPTPSSEPVISSVNDLRKVVKKKIKDKELRDEVDRYLTRIEGDYRNINEILLKGAGAGLSLSVAIHEIEKIAAELKIAIKKEKTPKRIIKLIKHLANIVESYGDLVRKAPKKAEDVVNVIEQAIFNVELRLEAHEIEVIKEFGNQMEKREIKCKRNLVIGSIMNIIDNSIWWLDYSKIKDRKIFISISTDLPGHLCIVIADNGPDFTLPTEEITKPFVSGKPDGMGLGLHIVKEVMRMQGGRLLFPEKDEFVLPGEFRDGAVTVLAFKREDEK
jgi:anti-sigma regulatory factor (Ser/Thr protein kinase)